MARLINKKIWLIFGAGGIGRGLLAQIAQESGYQTIFVAKNKEQAEFLNEIDKYSINFLGKESKKKLIINNFKALNFQNEREIIETILEENLEIITTSVRPENLEDVAKILAKGLTVRKNQKIKGFLIILTCENIIGGAKNLRKMIDKNGKVVIKEIFIPEVMVDCIIPKQPADSVTVNREEYGEIFIEKTKNKKINQILSKLVNVRVVKDLPNYQIQKIFGLNGMHLAIAILGVVSEKKYVHEALSSPKTKEILPGLIQEMTEAIYHATGFSKKDIKSYLKEVMSRFSNPNLPDENERIIRNIRQKLGPEERLLKPAQLVFKTGKTPNDLISVIAQGVGLVMKRENIKDIKKAVKEICQLPKTKKDLKKRIIHQVPLVKQKVLGRCPLDA